MTDQNTQRTEKNGRTISAQPSLIRRAIQYIQRKDKEKSHFRIEAESLADLYDRKNHDYGNSFSDMFSEYGICYPVMHLQEKLARIKVLSKDKNKVEGEGMQDSLRDLAAYALMTIVELNKK